MRKCCRDLERINSQQSRGGILLTSFVVSFCGAAGLQGRIEGGSGARQRPEARDIAKMKREEKGWRELMEKAAGDERLYNLLEDRAGRWSAPRRHTKRGGR
jgi:hypothetical protein